MAAACVFSLAVACYLLSFSGIPISDDEELYASAARNLAVDRALTAEQMYGNTRLAGSYHGVEPAFPVLASLWYRLFLPAPFGHLQTLYLLPVLCTALSAALVVIIAAQLGFSTTVGAMAALLYAFGSIAWPYAKTLFREPLIVLLLLSSLSAYLWLVRERRTLAQTLWMAILLLLLLAALTLTRVVMAVTGVFMLIALPLVHPSLRGKRSRMALFALGTAALALGLGATLGALHATDADVFYRFTGGFLRDALIRLNTMPHTHLLEALAAPLVSPWKGLLHYSPICAVGFVSAWANARRQPVLSSLTFFVLAALLLVQALAYDGDWWTPTWGTRFLLPAIPLLVLASLPVLERLMRWGRAGWLMIGALFAAGFAVQLPAVLFNSAEFTATTYPAVAGAFPEALIWDITETPIITQWHAIASQEPDLLLWRTLAYQPVVVVAGCVLAGGVMVLGLAALRRTLGNRRSRLFLACCAAMLLLSTLALLRAGTDDPAYEMTQFQPLCSYIQNHIQPADMLIVQPYPGPAWQYLMNSECGQRVWYSLPYRDAQSSAARLIAQKIPAGTHYWLLQQVWSDTSVMGAEGLVPGGDLLLGQATFLSPYRLSVASYERGQAR